MSRLAKRPVLLNDAVKFSQSADRVTVSGPKGELNHHIPADRVKITHDDKSLMVTAASELPRDSAASGLVRNMLANMVRGVQEEFVKELVFSGVGYRAVADGQKLTLSVGFSHPVVLEAPDGVSVAVQKSTIRITGADNQAVGQFATDVRRVRPPEPYKGKGIAYATEHIRRKAGKAGKAGA